MGILCNFRFKIKNLYLNYEEIKDNLKEIMLNLDELLKKKEKYFSKVIYQ